MSTCEMKRMALDQVPCDLIPRATVGRIVWKYLRDNGYDGLHAKGVGYAPPCQCAIKDGRSRSIGCACIHMSECKPGVWDKNHEFIVKRKGDK